MIYSLIKINKFKVNSKIRSLHPEKLLLTDFLELVAMAMDWRGEKALKKFVITKNIFIRCVFL